MFRILLISFLVALTSLSSFSQGSITVHSDKKESTRGNKPKKNLYLDLDTAKYKVTYSCKITPDTSIADHKITGFVVTLVGNKYAKFIDKAMLDSHLLRIKLTNENVPRDQRTPKVVAAMQDKVFKEEIIINYPKKDTNFFHHFLSGNYKQYEDSTAIQQWNLCEETKDYLGYKCRKATCHFRGRDYEAWYTEDIPIPFGPYVFRGLPGLITELYDTNKEYSFNMVGFEKPSEVLTLYLYNGKMKEQITREDFRFLKEYYNENGAASLFDGPIKLQVTPERKAEMEKRLNRPRPYNPIELE